MDFQCQFSEEVCQSNELFLYEGISIFVKFYSTNKHKASKINFLLFYINEFAKKYHRFVHFLLVLFMKSKIIRKKKKNHRLITGFRTP